MVVFANRTTNRRTKRTENKILEQNVYQNRRMFLLAGTLAPSGAQAYQYLSRSATLIKNKVNHKKKCLVILYQSQVQSLRNYGKSINHNNDINNPIYRVTTPLIFFYLSQIFALAMSCSEKGSFLFTGQDNNGSKNMQEFGS